MSNYSLQNYAKMISDPVRMPAYMSALKTLIKPDTVVLDLGAGTGAMTIIACNLGAKHVYAVDPNPALQVAIELANINGFKNQVTFFNEGIETAKIPEKVDLIVSDLRGKLPFYSDNLRLVEFAKKQFLKADGVLIPFKDKIYMSLCSDANLYNESVEPWTSIQLGFDSSIFSKQLSNCFYQANIKPEMLASQIYTWCEIDYHNITSYSHNSSIILEPTKNTVHGFLLWFEAELTKDIRFSCGPNSNNRVYGSAFFPFEKPLEINPEHKLRIDLSANYLESDYIWRWKTSLVNEQNNTLLFDQSNFLGIAFSNKSLERS